VVLARVLATMLLSKRPTSAPRKLMRSIQAISSGDLQTPITVKSHDEIGELANVLETMRQKLAEAAAQNETLLNNVREEAEKLAQARQDLEIANADLENALVTESEARKRIEEINRLKDEFAGMVSHELKTPVSY